MNERPKGSDIGLALHVETAKDQKLFTGGSRAVGAVSRSHDFEIELRTVFQIPQKSETGVAKQFGPRVVDVVPLCQVFDPVVQSCLGVAERITVMGVALTVQHCQQFVPDELGVVVRIEIADVHLDAFGFPGEQQIGCLLDGLGKVQLFRRQFEGMKVAEPFQVSDLVHAEEKEIGAHEFILDRGDQVFHLFSELFVLFWRNTVTQVRCLFDDLEDLAENGLRLVVRVVLANLTGDRPYLGRDNSFRGFGTVRRLTLVHARAVVFNMDSQFRWFLLRGVIDWHLHLGTAPTVTLRTAFACDDLVFFVFVRALDQEGWMMEVFKPNQSSVGIGKLFVRHGVEFQPFSFGTRGTLARLFLCVGLRRGLRHRW